MSRRQEQRVEMEDEQLARAESQSREAAREITHEHTESARVVSSSGSGQQQQEPGILNSAIESEYRDHAAAGKEDAAMAQKAEATKTMLGGEADTETEEVKDHAAAHRAREVPIEPSSTQEFSKKATSS